MNKLPLPTPNLPNWSPSIFVLCLLVLIGKREFIRSEKSDNFQNVVLNALFFLSLLVSNFQFWYWPLSRKNWEDTIQQLNKPEIEKLQSHLRPGQLSHLTPSHPLVTKIQPFLPKHWGAIFEEVGRASFPLSVPARTGRAFRDGVTACVETSSDEMSRKRNLASSWKVGGMWSNSKGPHIKIKKDRPFFQLWAATFHWFKKCPLKMTTCRPPASKILWKDGFIRGNQGIDQWICDFKQTAIFCKVFVVWPLQK